jgi:hypothetical protein
MAQRKALGPSRSAVGAAPADCECGGDCDATDAAANVHADADAAGHEDGDSRCPPTPIPSKSSSSRSGGGETILFVFTVEYRGQFLRTHVRTMFTSVTLSQPHVRRSLFRIASPTTPDVAPRRLRPLRPLDLPFCNDGKTDCQVRQG